MLGWRWILALCDCCCRGHEKEVLGTPHGATITDDDWSDDDEEEDVTFTAQAAPGMFAFTAGNVKEMTPL
ncbi:hypothetical protein H257_00199 [Aphanomyces astaci]|uniref:Uncharacterized protein n=1 Tax=Aphanomyces astaci TaxID=112090 RepID=W4H9S3_APHAT|nr:hypothetical protein H257_00199 [Aphanomyces astaci]ETV88667.1 hypothetical protein H257_00199 [Aphanomyces astaci]|eukprot:XP_009821067.1 hypothetical protein H257_00199 [Aphanomyces astaci]